MPYRPPGPDSPQMRWVPGSRAVRDSAPGSRLFLVKSRAHCPVDAAQSSEQTGHTQRYPHDSGEDLPRKRGYGMPYPLEHPASAAALAPERSLAGDRTMLSVDLGMAGSPATPAGSGLLPALALQRLTALALHLVLGSLADFRLRGFRHEDLLCAYEASLARRP